jgi:L-iditol 2-dehydrogenase
MAAALGADFTLHAENVDVPAETLKLTDGRGADAAFEVVGATTPVNTALNSLRKGGKLTLVGNISPKIDLMLQSVVTREITLLGSCASNGEYPECLDLIASGGIDVSALVSKTAPMSEGAEWFKRLYDKEAGLMKVVLTND